MSDNPGYLYRHFAADRSLVYMGISKSALRRLAEHHNWHWFPFIKRVTIKSHPNMEAARIAERKALAEENLRFNEAGRRWEISGPRLAKPHNWRRLPAQRNVHA